MNRRNFVMSAAIVTAVTTLIGKGTRVLAKPLPKSLVNPCIPNLDYISAEATVCQRYEHFHRFSIPVSALINPPAEGFTERTSNLDQPSLDEVAFQQFLKDSGISEGELRFHSHSITVTQEQLERIAQGEKNVAVELIGKNNKLSHVFYFTASQSALIKIARARSGGT